MAIALSEIRKLALRKGIVVEPARTAKSGPPRVTLTDASGKKIKPPENDGFTLGVAERHLSALPDRVAKAPAFGKRTMAPGR